MICFTYNLHLAVMSAETEPGPNLNSLKFKALRTIRDLFYPTLELRIVGLSLVFLSLAISAETPEDIIYQFAPGVVVVLCIVFSTWLEMFSNYVKDMELRPSVSSGLHYGMMLVPLVITALIQNASHDPSLNRRYMGTRYKLLESDTAITMTISVNAVFAGLETRCLYHSVYQCHDNSPKIDIAWC